MEALKQINDQIALCEEEIAARAAAKSILLAKREEVRQHARDAARPTMLATIEELGFTPEDLFEILKKAKPDENAPKKYRDPVSGDEYSGRGNGPSWFDRDNKKQYLNPAWVEHNKKAKDAGKAKPADSVAQADESTKPAAELAQEPASAPAAYQTIAAPAASEVMAQGTAPAANTAQDEGSASGAANPTIATTASIATVAATDASEASTSNANVASTPTSVLPATDSGSQPLVIAA